MLTAVYEHGWATVRNNHEADWLTMQSTPVGLHDSVVTQFQCAGGAVTIRAFDAVVTKWTGSYSTKVCVCPRVFVTQELC